MINNRYIRILNQTAGLDVLDDTKIRVYDTLSPTRWLVVSGDASTIIRDGAAIDTVRSQLRWEVQDGPSAR